MLFPKSKLLKLFQYVIKKFTFANEQFLDEAERLSVPGSEGARCGQVEKQRPEAVPLALHSSNKAMVQNYKSDSN